LRVEGSMCMVQGIGFRVQGSGLRVQGSGFRVEECRPGSRGARRGIYRQKLRWLRRMLTEMTVYLAHQFGRTGPVPASKLTKLYRNPSMLT